MARRKKITPDNVLTYLWGRQGIPSATEIALGMGYGKDGIEAVTTALETLAAEGRIKWQSS